MSFYQCVAFNHPSILISCFFQPSKLRGSAGDGGRLTLWTCCLFVTGPQRKKTIGSLTHSYGQFTSGACFWTKRKMENPKRTTRRHGENMQNSTQKVHARPHTYLFSWCQNTKSKSLQRLRLVVSNSRGSTVVINKHGAKTPNSAVTQEVSPQSHLFCPTQTL